MKKILLTIAITLGIGTTVLASIGNPNKLHETVKDGYSVGFVIDDSTILGSDFHMWNINKDNLIRGYYVAYELDTDTFYYITQDTAQEYLEREGE